MESQGLPMTRIRGEQRQPGAGDDPDVTTRLMSSISDILEVLKKLFLLSFSFQIGSEFFGDVRWYAEIV
jgi:hypothetical protein